MQNGRASVAIGLGTRLLHWLSAALVAVVFGLAWSFNALGHGETSGRLVEVHRSVGLSLLGLTLLRLLWRALRPLPPLPRGPAWEVWLARGVQALLYIGLVAQPLIGWAGSSSQGDTVSYLGLFTLPDLLDADPDRAERIFALHKTIGIAILALLTLHIAGALRHALVKRDGVLRRMVTGQATQS